MTRRAVASVLGALLAGLPRAASPQDGGAGNLAWLHAETAADAHAALQRVLAALPPAGRHEYLVALGSALYDENDAPRHADRRAFQLHLPLLHAHAATAANLVEWFTHRAAGHLAGPGGDPEGALGLLTELAPRFVAPMPVVSSERRLLEHDCRIALEQLVAADEAAREYEAQAEGADRVLVIARRCTIDLLLGRLDHAARRLDAAERLLAAAQLPKADARRPEFELLQRRLDLLHAGEQFAAVEPTIARFAARAAADGIAPSRDQQLVLDLHGAAASYRATQTDPGQIGAARDRLQRLRDHSPVGSRAMLSLWLADLELRDGRHAKASALLASTGTPTSRRDRWLALVLTSELDRNARANDTSLERNEHALRAVLDEMIAEWRAVAWDRESTGFLRLGLRLRVLAELIEVTMARHGPARALEDVLRVQCCTTVSRARGAEPAPIETLQARLAERHGVIVFVPAWNVSHVFALDRAGLVHRRLASASSLRALAAHARRDLLAVATETGPATAANGSTRALAEALLPDDIRELAASWDHLTIAGGNLLGSPPFACLPWQDDRLLGERFALTTIASVPLLAALERDAPALVAGGSLSARLFATLAPARDFAERNHLGPPVPLAGADWRRLQDSMPRRTAAFVDGAATPAAFAATSPGGVLTVVVAHGEHPVGEAPSTLGLTADDEHADGALTVDEIRLLRQHGCVVVAACHGSRGRVRVGDDDVADSIAGAFLVSGATAVVASGAPLRASLHLAVCGELVRAIATGATPAEALRRARLVVGGGDPAQRLRVGQIDVYGLGSAALVATAAHSSKWWRVALGVIAAVALITAAGRGRTRWPPP
jgi:CHAT domain-containing protein